MRVLMLTATLTAVGSAAVANMAHGPESPAGQAEAAAAAPRPPAIAAALAHLSEAAQPMADGSLVIGNAAYRTTFSADGGVVYTPRIDGREEPRLRWQYRARAIETGGRSRALEPAAPRVSPTGAHVVDFARPGLIERYEGERTGVEQIFVLTERPDRPGDVRIRGDVAFDGERRQSDAGLEFAVAGLAPMRYANPVAFDAERRPIAVRAELRGEALDLVLDGAALAGAAFPVTIDPLFGVAVIATGGWGVDLAYNVDRGEYLVVYEVHDGRSSTTAIRARRFAEDGSAIGSAFTVSSPADVDCSLPAAAYDPVSDRYLVTWGLYSPDNTSVVRARLLDSTGVPVAAPIQLSPANKSAGVSRIAVRDTRSDGDAGVAFAVAWQQANADSSNTVKVTRLTAAGVVLGQHAFNTFEWAGSTQVADIAYAPSTDRFLIVRVNGRGPTGAVWARTLTSAGSSGPLTTISTGEGASHALVTHDRASRRFLVAWSNEGSLGIWGRRVSADGVSTIGDTFQINPGGMIAALRAETGSFSILYETFQEGGWPDGFIRHRRALATGAVLGETVVDTQGAKFLTAGHGISYHGDVFSTFVRIATSEVKVAHQERWWSRAVHGRGGDFDGDGRSDLFFYRRATGMFHVKTRTGESAYAIGDKDGIPVLVEIDGDGLADIGVFDRSSGQFIIRKSTTQATEVFAFGTGGDIPVPGDYVGDDRDELAVYRPSTFAWYILASGQASPTVYPYGVAGGIPTPADWNGDGKIELGVWGAANGMWYWSSLDFLQQGQAQWGQTGDIPLQGNFVGSAHADQVVYRRQEGRWHIRNGETGTWSTSTQGDGIPTPLDWNGDGRLDLGLFQWENQRWLIRNATAQQGNTIVSFGGLADVPAGSGQ